MVWFVSWQVNHRNQKPKEQQGLQINNRSYTLQISISFSTTMRKQHNKGYKGGCQWNWHFSNGFLSGKQISTALLELNAKQNLYNTQESLYSEWRAADVLSGLVLETDEVRSERAAAGLHSHQRRQGTWLTKPHQIVTFSTYLPLLKVCFSFLPSWIQKGLSYFEGDPALMNSINFHCSKSTVANHPNFPQGPFIWPKPASTSKHD